MKLRNVKYHFVGIGGIGMCGLAELLRNMGSRVSGSDLSENSNTERLKKLGIPVYLGHKEEHISDADVVVFSSAVRSDNPEIVAAKRKKIPIIPRAEALAELMRLKRGIAVGGTHGKTTTTAMIASIFLRANNNPTVIIGGKLDLIQSTAQLGNGEWLIAEADESDGSFQRLSPEVVIVTNIDNDHMDYFQNEDNLCKAFYSFAELIPFYGLVIACGDDILVRKTLVHFSKRVVYYGFNESNDYQLIVDHGKYFVQHEGKNWGQLTLSAAGRHNALNALAAVIAAQYAGISFDQCNYALSNFSGVDRRFQLKGEKGGVKVYDDYAHHPTEIKSTLQAFREQFPHRRLVILFQPHRYSRTQICWNDFLDSFAECDQLYITDIYAASEQPIVNVNSERFAHEIRHPHVHYVKKGDRLAQKIVSELAPNDIFVTFGAGDVWRVGMEVLECLK